MNPKLYGIASGSYYSQAFHDISDGSTNGYYPAVAGYDLATGLGTPNGANLSPLLIQGITAPGQARFTASPNPIPVAPDAVVGQTTFSWNAQGVNNVGVHVGTPGGPLFTQGASIGQAQTGLWVNNGLVFYLVNSSSGATIAQTTVTLAAPTPIPTTLYGPPSTPVLPGQMGQFTLVYDAPGVSQTKIVTGSPTGPVLSMGGSSGSAATGQIVTDGMLFFLEDPGGNQLASFAAHLTVVQPTASGILSGPSSIPAGAGQPGECTLTFDAPGVSGTKIFVAYPANSPVLSEGGSSGSATTGQWVSDGMEFFLEDLSGNVLATYTAHLQSSASAILSGPSPVPVGVGQLGQLTLSFSAPGVSRTKIVVGSPTGTVLSEGGSSGSAATGQWVSDGMQFFLEDLSGNQLASYTAHLSVIQLAPALLLGPSLIPASTGQPGQFTLIYEAPGVAGTKIVVGSPNGTVLSEGGSSGSVATGQWVSDGMQFFLEDANGNQLASFTAHVVSP